MTILRSLHSVNSIFGMCLFLILLSPLFSSAQDVEFNRTNFPDKKIYKSIEENLLEAEYYFQEADYQSALIYYEKAYRYNPENARLNYKIGICYLNLYPRAKAVTYIEKAHLLAPGESLFIRQLAEVLRLNYEFEKSIVMYQKFKSALSPEELAAEQDGIDKRVKECRFAMEKVKNPEALRIENLGSSINSPYPEYSPIITADESVLFFTSRRPGTTGEQRDPTNPGFYEDIYLSYNINGKWTDAYNPGIPLNTSNHDAVVGLSNDGQRLLTYKGIRGGGIYESRLQGTEWSKPRRIPPPLNSRYHEPSATFSFDERTMYFISNRPGGIGGSDIYVSTYTEGKGWSEPQNLGIPVNTPDDEEAVFLHPDGKTLYLSSRGHEGMGGYDIFKTICTNGIWSQPQNMGYPINTPDDDVFFSITADNRHAYFSSAREGGLGGQDIYKVSFYGYDKKLFHTSEDQLIAVKAATHNETILDAFIPITTSMMILLKGQVTDETSNKPLMASIDLIDNAKNEIIATFTSNSQTGRFLVSLPAGKNYGIALRAEGYLFHSENFNIPKLHEFIVVEKDIVLKKIEKGKEITLNNVFFDYNEYRLRKESINELERVVEMMIKYPSLIIEISGHTDNIGTAEFNKELSLQRAKAVVDFLISKGIEANRLQYIGYGFEKTLVPNDTEEGRKLNRRSEFKVVER